MQMTLQVNFDIPDVDNIYTRDQIKEAIVDQITGEIWLKVSLPNGGSVVDIPAQSSVADIPPTT
jgi:hypothetical protein